MKKMARGPWLYIVAALAVLWVGLLLFGRVTYTPISTKEGLEFLSSGEVSSVVVTDREQRVDMELKSPHETFGSNVQFYYVAPRGLEVLLDERLDTLKGARVAFLCNHTAVDRRLRAERHAQRADVDLARRAVPALERGGARHPGRERGHTLAAAEISGRRARSP